MNKSKLTLAVIGGVIGVAVLVMLFLVWNAYSAKSVALEGDEDEGVDGLETVEAKAASLSGKPVYPGKASVDAIESNRTVVVGWRDDALKLAAHGDRPIEKTTPAAFKTFIVADAKRLAALPGGVGGVLVKPEFAFGPFKDYIAGGVMPADDKLTELQRRWDDVATIVEALAKCGISELVDVQFAAPPAPEEEEPAKKGRKSNARKAKAGADESRLKPVSFSYVFTFNARQAAFVKCVNALETCERFVTVDDFSFVRETDVIAQALGGGEAKSESRSTGRRGRRRAIEEKTEEEDKPKAGIVTDPLLDPPMKVRLTASVYDFRSCEGAEDKTEEVKK